MKGYELTILLPANLSEGELEKVQKKVTALLAKSSAKVTKEEKAVKKALAYEIKKLREAVYLFYELTLSPDKIAGLEKNIRLEEDILRHLLVVKE